MNLRVVKVVKLSVEKMMCYRLSYSLLALSHSDLMNGKKIELGYELNVNLLNIINNNTTNTNDENSNINTFSLNNCSCGGANYNSIIDENNNHSNNNTQIIDDLMTS